MKKVEQFEFLGENILSLMSLLLNGKQSFSLKIFLEFHGLLNHVNQLLIDQHYFSKVHDYATRLIRLIEKRQLPIDQFETIFEQRDMVQRGLKSPSAKPFLPIEDFVTPIEDILESLKGNHHVLLFEAEKSNNQAVIEKCHYKMTEDEKEIEYQFAMKFFHGNVREASRTTIDFYQQYIPSLIQHLRDFNKNEFAWRLMYQFIMLHREIDLKINLDWFSKLCAIGHQIIKPITQPTSGLNPIEIANWFQYKQILLQARNDFLNSEKSIIEKQEVFSGHSKELVMRIIKDSLQLIDCLPGTYCFLSIGSLAKQQMTLYSDIELVLLLDDEAYNYREKYVQLMNIIEFKMMSIGESGKNCLGFRLDEMSNFSKNSFYCGTVESILRNGFSENNLQSHEGYSMLHAQYLLGDEILCCDLQAKMKTMLENNELYRRMAIAQMSSDISQFKINAADRNALQCDIKLLFLKPLQYAIYHLGLYHNSIGKTFIETLDLLSQYFSEERKLQTQRAYELIQTIRNSAQIQTHSQNETISANKISHSDDYVLLDELIEQLTQINHELLQPLYDHLDVLLKTNTLISHHYDNETALELYRDAYMLLPHVERFLFLNDVKFFDTHRYELCFHILGLIPDAKCRRLYTDQQKNHWLKELALLQAVKHDVDDNEQLTSRFFLTMPGQTVEQELSSIIVQQIWNEEKNEFIDWRENHRERNSQHIMHDNHKVVRIELYDDELGNCHFFLKIDPEMPGNEILACEAHQMVFGFGSPFCELGKLRIEHRDQSMELHAVLVTQAISGAITLEDQLALNANTVLEHANYSQQFIMSMLLNSGDLHFRNLICALQPNTKPNEERLFIQGLSAIDHDRVFMRDAYDHHKLLLNNCLLTLDAANTPLDESIVKTFVAIDTKQFIDLLLTRMFEKDHQYRVLFNDREAQYLLSKNNCVVQLTFRERLFSWLFHRFDCLQRLLSPMLRVDDETSSEAGTLDDTPDDINTYSALWLCYKIYPKMATQYLTSFRDKKLSNAGLRFASICGASYQTIPGMRRRNASTINCSFYQLGPSLVSGRWLYSSILGEHCKKLEDVLDSRYHLEKQRYHIDIIVNITNAVQTSYDALIKCRDKNNVSQAMAYFNELPDFAKEHVLAYLNFSQLIPELIIAIWKKLKTTKITCLTLNHFDTLTSKNLLSLCKILKPTLRELTLNTCDGLTEIVDTKIINQLERIRIESCTQLTKLNIQTPDLVSLELPGCINLSSYNTHSTCLERLNIESIKLTDEQSEIDNNERELSCGFLMNDNLFDVEFMKHAKRQLYESGINPVIVGAEKVGKTVFIKNLFENNNYVDYCDTIGLESFLMNLRIGKCYVPQNVWVPSARARYANLTKTYFRDKSCYLLIFDLTNRSSITYLLYKSNQIIKEQRSTAFPIFLLVGNKTDINDREVSFKEAISLAKKIGASHYFEASGKTGENVEAVFLTASVMGLLYEAYGSSFISIDMLKTITNILYKYKHAIVSLEKINFLLPKEFHIQSSVLEKYASSLFKNMNKQEAEFINSLPPLTDIHGHLDSQSPTALPASIATNQSHLFSASQNNAEQNPDDRDSALQQNNNT